MNYLDFDQGERKNKQRKLFFKVFFWVVQIAVVIGAAYLIIRYTVEKTTMLGNSMEPALHEEDKIIISKFSYFFSGPARFDVIVFKQSGKEHSYYNIKRVIGLPGETIQIKEGFIYIDGEKLEEPIEVVSMNVAGLADEPIILEDNEYFVLGDNRNNSEDSRFANIGTVVKNDIIGKAWLRTEPEFAFISKLNLRLKEEAPEDKEQKDSKE